MMLIELASGKLVLQKDPLNKMLHMFRLKSLGVTSFTETFVKFVVVILRFDSKMFFHSFSAFFKFSGLQSAAFFAYEQFF